jgi:hypothetical protein
MAKNRREQAQFNLAIDSKLRGCDMVKLKVCDVAQVGRVSSRATDFESGKLRTNPVGRLSFRMTDLSIGSDIYRKKKSWVRIS